jgi:hypothetical protein
MVAIGYIPYERTAESLESGFLANLLGCRIKLAKNAPTLNLAQCGQLPDFDDLQPIVEALTPLPWVVAEGPGGFLWSAVLRAGGYSGGFTIIPYLNPRSWYDVACISNYLHFASPQDRIFLGSTPSARIYAALGVRVSVGEPYGVDCDRFSPRPVSDAVLERLAIPHGRILLYVGRLQADKDIYRFLRVGLRARILFPDLSIVIASRVVDESYLAGVRRRLGPEQGVYFVHNLTPKQLADLYNAADVFATAAVSHFETFGRAPAEALACGTPAVAPRYDGFAEVLAQPGGSLVDVKLSEGILLVDEEHMLRAIYDILTSPKPIPPERIAAEARRRFHRTRTIHLLDYMLNPNFAEVAPDRIPPAEIPLPNTWNREFQEMARLPPLEALSRMWNSRLSKRLEKDNRQFQDVVRMSLFQSANSVGGDETTCH